MIKGINVFSRMGGAECDSESSGVARDGWITDGGDEKALFPKRGGELERGG